jgi:2-oxoglutarate ferredoxin oxidoreductase subunit delta
MRHQKIKKHFTKFIVLNPLYCTACWKCIGECPKKVIGKSGILVHKHAHIVKSNECVGCKKCIKVCPHQAIFELPKSRQSYTSKPNDYTREDWARVIISLLS